MRKQSTTEAGSTKVPTSNSSTCKVCNRRRTCMISQITTHVQILMVIKPNKTVADRAMQIWIWGRREEGGRESGAGVVDGEGKT